MKLVLLFSCLVLALSEPILPRNVTHFRCASKTFNQRVLSDTPMVVDNCYDAKEGNPDEFELGAALVDGDGQVVQSFEPYGEPYRKGGRWIQEFELDIKPDYNGTFIKISKRRLTSSYSEDVIYPIPLILVPPSPKMTSTEKSEFGLYIALPATFIVVVVMVFVIRSLFNMCMKKKRQRQKNHDAEAADDAQELQQFR